MISNNGENGTLASGFLIRSASGNVTASNHTWLATFMAMWAAQNRRHTPEPRDLAPGCNFIPTVEDHWKHLGNVITCHGVHTTERFTEMRLKKRMWKYLNFKVRIFFFTWNAFISNASCFLSLSALGGMGTRSHPDRTLWLATPLRSCVNLKSHLTSQSWGLYLTPDFMRLLWKLHKLIHMNVTYILLAV